MIELCVAAMVGAAIVWWRLSWQNLRRTVRRQLRREVRRIERVINSRRTV